jgi:hypothetical protein
MEYKPPVDRKKASDFPQELLNLFDGYVHGAIGRRAFLHRAQKFAVGGVTAAALFQMLKPTMPDPVPATTSGSSRDCHRAVAGQRSKGSPRAAGNDKKLPVVL